MTANIKTNKLMAEMNVSLFSCFKTTPHQTLILLCFWARKYCNRKTHKRVFFYNYEYTIYENGTRIFSPIVFCLTPGTVMKYAYIKKNRNGEADEFIL